MLSQGGIPIANVRPVQGTQIIDRSEALDERAVATTKSVEAIGALTEVPGRSQTTLGGARKSTKSTHVIEISKEHKRRKPSVDG